MIDTREPIIIPVQLYNSIKVGVIPIHYKYTI